MLQSLTPCVASCDMLHSYREESSPLSLHLSGSSTPYRLFTTILYICSYPLIWMSYLCQPEDVLTSSSSSSSFPFLEKWWYSDRTMNLPVFYRSLCCYNLCEWLLFRMILIISEVKLITIIYTNSVPTSQRTHRFVITSTRGYMKIVTPCGQICTLNIIYSMRFDFNYIYIYTDRRTYNVWNYKLSTYVYSAARFG